MKLLTPIYYDTDQLDLKSVHTMFLIDIMRMRELNEVYGYQNGTLIIEQFSTLFEDTILPQIENLLQKFNMEDIGMEFKNQYVDIFSLKFNYKLDDRIILKIKNLIFETILTREFKVEEYGVKINIDITIGCAQGKSEELMIYAEKALYNAKENYEHYSFCDDQLNGTDILKNNLLDIMRYNIDEKMVEPFFQEIMDTEKSTTHKYEALMRLIDENNNILSPIAFMDKAKKYRLYPQLMKVMIEKVFNIIRKHKIYASINLDYHDLTDSNLMAYIISELEKKDIGQYLTVEILESEKIHDFDKVNDCIQELRRYGVLVAIDDFGSGFSNYEQLLLLDVDYIKLDGSLVKRINEEIYYDLIKSIVGFCKKQNIKVVAEFVSSLAILRYIKSLKIEYSQGYYISKPKKISEVIKDRS